MLLPLPFIPNQIYNRRKDIHGNYGGSWQGGIAPSKSFPFIFIFSSETGHDYGYKDAWDNPYVYSYTGRGQIGDMKFKEGNLALRDHVKNNKRVFLFEGNGRGSAKFIDEVELIKYNFQDIPDKLGNQRIGITFFFKRKGIYLPAEIDEIFKQNLITDPSPKYESKIPQETERKGLITSRIGQGAYRDRVILRWNSKCAVTGFNKPKLLIASHILPWSDATNQERLDPFNGILLSPNYDALFDRHFITFENSGNIILSDKLETNAYKKLGVTGNEVIKDFSTDNHFYLEKHRQRFNETNR